MADASKEHLLSENNFSHQDSDYDHEQTDTKLKGLFGSRIAEGLICILLFLSLCTNAAFSIHFTAIENIFSEKRMPQRTRYAHLEDNAIQIPFTAHNAYVEPPSSPNDTSRDEMWLSMNVDRLAIALDHREAKDLGLKKSKSFVWDETKGYYGINAYHSLHCLQLLYTALMEEDKNIQPRTQKFQHLVHCLDSLRQDVICAADDTLVYNDPASGKRPGEGDIRQCKDFSKLEEWAWASERNACFTLKANESDPSSYRSWNRCRPDSPFFPKMREHYGYDEDWKINYELHKTFDGPSLSWN